MLKQQIDGINLVAKLQSEFWNSKIKITARMRLGRGAIEFCQGKLCFYPNLKIQFTFLQSGARNST